MSVHETCSTSDEDVLWSVLALGQWRYPASRCLYAHDVDEADRAVRGHKESARRRSQCEHLPNMVRADSRIWREHVARYRAALRS